MRFRRILAAGLALFLITACASGETESIKNESASEQEETPGSATEELERQVESLLEEKNYAEAVRVIEEGMKELGEGTMPDPFRELAADAYQRYAEELTDSERYSDALAMLEKLCGLFPEEPVYEMDKVYISLLKEYGAGYSRKVFCPMKKGQRRDYPVPYISPDQNLIGVLGEWDADLDEDSTDEKLVLVIRKTGTDTLYSSDLDWTGELCGIVIDHEKGTVLVSRPATLSDHVMQGETVSAFAAFLKESDSAGTVVGGTGLSNAGVFSDGRYTDTYVWKYSNGTWRSLIQKSSQGSGGDDPFYGSDPTVVKAKELGFQSAEYWDPITNYISSREPDCRFLVHMYAELNVSFDHFYPDGQMDPDVPLDGVGLSGTLETDPAGFDDWLGMYGQGGTGTHDTGDPEYLDEYLLPFSDVRAVTEADLAGMSAQELTYARNELYARHGRVFVSTELNEYFGQMSWYHPDPSWEAESLAGIERDNAYFILNYQEKTGLKYQPW